MVSMMLLEDGGTEKLPRKTQLYGQLLKQTHKTKVKTLNDALTYFSLALSFVKRGH